MSKQNEHVNLSNFILLAVPCNNIYKYYKFNLDHLCALKETKCQILDLACYLNIFNLIS